MAFLDPVNILNKLNLKENLTAADFGCGSGFWVLPLARKLKLGKVYAIDILEDPLSALKSRMKLEKIINVETSKSDIEKTSKLISDSCDLVLMTNLLFQIEDKKKAIEEGKRVLKKEGKILVVDWKKEASLGPKSRVSPEEIKTISEELDFKIGKEFEASTYHWGLILVK
ncbi:MAG: class I SAM-dependent methyltransferase [Patescibacteria group bacterium]|nr:class I SAM-dependent methyltransferase [Patescibacteria group bacterium]